MTRPVVALPRCAAGTTVIELSPFVRSAHLLLRNRLMEEFMHQCGLSSPLTKVIRRELVVLQAAIYELDCFGEENWEIDTSRLAQLWQAIRKASSGLYDEGVMAAGLGRIEEYQDIELQLRRGRQIGELEILSFYSKKTCDVGLLRDLVLSKMDESSENHILAAAWGYFDLVSEVIDDIYDLREDCVTYNGNRLISAGLIHGLSFACNEYSRLLEYLAGTAESQMSSLCDGLRTEDLARKVYWQAAAAAKQGLRLLRRARVSTLLEVLLVSERRAA